MSGPLTHSPADVVRTLLIDLSLATAPSASGSWPAYVDQEPDAPDNVITVTDSAGIRQGRFMADGEVQEKHGFQIRIRSNDHYEGYEKSRDIAVALDESVNLTTVSVGDDAGTGSDSYLIQCISGRGSILRLGKDTPRTKLNLFTINALVTLKQTT